MYISTSSIRSHKLKEEERKRPDAARLALQELDPLGVVWGKVLVYIGVTSRQTYHKVIQDIWNAKIRINSYFHIA